MLWLLIVRNDIRQFWQVAFTRILEQSGHRLLAPGLIYRVHSWQPLEFISNIQTLVVQLLDTHVVHVLLGHCGRCRSVSLICYVDGETSVNLLKSC